MLSGHRVKWSKWQTDADSGWSVEPTETAEIYRTASSSSVNSSQVWLHTSSVNNAVVSTKWSRGLTTNMSVFTACSHCLQCLTSCNSHCTVCPFVRPSARFRCFVTSYLSLFPSYGSLLVKFLLATVNDLTLMPSLGVIPCEYPDDLYLSRN